jgi:C-terminal processing protease CtpA/Prc
MFPAPTSEDVEKFAARNADAISRAKQRETDQLLAAGFSLERIAWIRDRTAELLAEQTRAAAERKEKGLRNDDPYSLRYLIDSDLDLRKAMSDEEYARYRSATGRTTAVPVTGVAPGSNGESAGLQTGDEIVAYDGKRVFNYYDLEKAASEAGSVEVLVDVLRDGKKLQLAMPAGSVGISQQSWAEMQLNNRPCSASLMKLPPELRNKVCNPRTPAAPGSQDPEGPQLLPRSSGDN